MANLYDLSTTAGTTGQTVTRFQALRLGRLGYTGNRGTAALPAIAWEEDSTTGLYSSAASNVDVTAAGVRVGGFGTAGMTNTQLGAAADFTIWYPSVLQPAIAFTTGTWTATRIAAGNFVMRHTAAAQTSTIENMLGTDLNRITASRGFKPTSVKDIEIIATAALTTNTPDTQSSLFANNAATTITTTAVFGTITGTSPTATQANPYVTALTFGTPIFLADLTGYFFTKSVVLAATSAYDYAGFFLYGTTVV